MIKSKKGTADLKIKVPDEKQTLWGVLRKEGDSVHCVHCGKKISKKDHYCRYCGSKCDFGNPGRLNRLHVYPVAKIKIFLFACVFVAGAIGLWMVMPSMYEAKLTYALEYADTLLGYEKEIQVCQSGLDRCMKAGDRSQYQVYQHSLRSLEKEYQNTKKQLEEIRYWLPGKQRENLDHYLKEKSRREKV